MATVEGIMRDTLRCKSIIYHHVVHEIYHQADTFLEADIQLLHYSFNWQRQAGLLPLLRQFTTNGKKKKRQINSRGKQPVKQSNLSYVCKWQETECNFQPHCWLQETTK